jgi:hypothetical protein
MAERRDWDNAVEEDTVDLALTEAEAELGPIDWNRPAREIGLELGTRAGEILKRRPELVHVAAIEIFENLAAFLPVDPDEDIEEVQALVLASLIARHVLHRGIRIEELSELMARPRRSIYRWMRGGLSLIFHPWSPPRPRGMNRRYTLRDNRQSYLEMNPERLLNAERWPNELRPYIDFLPALLEGARPWFAVETNRQWFGTLVSNEMAGILRDARTPALLERALEAVQRVGMNFRALQSTPRFEREQLQKLLDSLGQLRAELPQLVVMLPDFANQIEASTRGYLNG